MTDAHKVSWSEVRISSMLCTWAPEKEEEEEGEEREEGEEKKKTKIPNCVIHMTQENYPCNLFLCPCFLEQNVMSWEA